jgi:hypothetical protein
VSLGVICRYHAGQHANWNDSDLRLLGGFELGRGMLENSLIEGWKLEVWWYWTCGRLQRRVLFVRFGVCLALVQRLPVDLLAHGDSWGSFECDII